MFLYHSPPLVTSCFPWLPGRIAVCQNPEATWGHWRQQTPGTRSHDPPDKKKGVGVGQEDQQTVSRAYSPFPREPQGSLSPGNPLAVAAASGHTVSWDSS